MVIDNGFTFNGQHSLNDMGLICVKGKSRYITSGKLYSYQVGGIPGTLAYGSDRDLSPFSVDVTLYSNTDLPSETQAQVKWRTVLAWLCCGRKQLIWDSEPGIAWTAEVTKVTAETGKDWPDESVKVTFLVQPEGRSVQQTIKSKEITSATEQSIVLTGFTTGAPAPLTLYVVNLGTTNITGVKVRKGTSTIQLSSLGNTFGAGAALLATCETPVSVTMGPMQFPTAANAMQYVSKLNRIMLNSNDTVYVTVTFSGEGTNKAGVQIMTNGVWA